MVLWVWSGSCHYIGGSLSTGTPSYLRPWHCGCLRHVQRIHDCIFMRGHFLWARVFNRGFLEEMAFELSLTAMSTCLSWEIDIQQASRTELGNGFCRGVPQVIR